MIGKVIPRLLIADARFLTDGILGMSYFYRPTAKFWEQFNALPARQKASARAALIIFKQDPFDPRLRTHKIHRLSAILKRTVHAVVIEGDLRAAFFIEGETVVSFAIGSHDIYKS